MLKKLESLACKIENGLAIILLFVISISVFAQVASRYAFEVPLSWTEELSRYCLIWLMFIGAAMALKEKGHFVVDLLVCKLPGKIRTYIEIALLVSIGAFVGIMMVTGVNLLPITELQISAALRIPMSYIYLSIPVGSALMLIHIAVLIKEHISCLSQPCEQVTKNFMD
jgi:C4-dicarboxylate transporter DctQ subunit